MRRKIIMIMLVTGLACSICSCGSNSSNTSQESAQENSINEEIASETVDEEEFLAQYNLLMASISEINTHASYVGNVHSLIWDNVGVDDVAKYIGHVRNFYNNEEYKSLICKAFGVSMFNSSESAKAAEYAQQYVDSLEMLTSKVKEAEALYSELNKTYGKEYNIEDLKNYYIESSTFADYASGVEGSYVTYNQTLNEFQTNIERLKTAAEIAY